MKTALHGLALLVLLAPKAGAQDKLALTEQDPYFPLKEGNTWTYKVTGDKEGKGPAVLKVVGFEKVDEDVCARLEWRRDKDLVATELFTVRKDGVFRVEFGGGRIKPPLMLIKRPVKAGDNWKFDSKIGDREIKGVFTAGEEKKLKVGDKVHDALTITSKDLKVEGQGMTTTYFFVEKIGLVKMIVEIGGTTVTLELDKFEEGKPK